MWRELFAELMEDVRQEAQNAGLDVETAADDLAEFAELQARRLAQALADDEPGYAEMVVASRDAVALKAAIMASDELDREYQRVVGLIQGMLAGVARTLALLA